MLGLRAGLAVPGFGLGFGLSFGLGLQRRAQGGGRVAGLAGCGVGTKAGVGAAGAAWSDHQQEQLAIGVSARLIGVW